MILYLLRVLLLLFAATNTVLVAASAANPGGWFHLLNTPFHSRFWPAYLLLGLVSFGLWLFTMRHADWDAITSPAEWPRRFRQRHAVTALALFKVLIAVGICQAGYLFLSTDDFCRIDIAYRWKERHFFATWDHVWLAGQFYVQGAFMHLLRDPMAAVRLSALLFSVVSAVSLYLVARDVFDRRTGYLALALFAVLPYPTWLSVSGHPNPFFLAFAVTGVFLLVTSRGRWPYLAGAGLSFCAATAFRYEGLLLGGVFGVWNLALLLTDRKRWNSKAITAHVVLMTLPFWYITAWSISCYRTLGDGFQFFRSAGEMTPPFITELGTFGRLLWYPRVLSGAEFVEGVRNEHSAPIFYLSLIAIPATLLWFRGRRGVIARYAFVVLFNFSLLMWSVVRGGGNVMAQRVVVLTQVLLVPFVAGLFFLAWDRLPGVRLPRGWRNRPRFARAAVILLFAALFGVELSKTLHFPHRMGGVDRDALRASRDIHHRFLDGNPSPKQVGAILLDEPIRTEEGWIFGVIGRYFEKTFHVGEGEEEKIRRSLIGKDYVLYVSFDDERPPPLPAEKISAQGPYRVWLFANPGPERVLALLAAGS